MVGFQTLIEALDTRAKTATRITHVLGPQEARHESFTQLRQRALGLLAHLQRMGLRPGDEVVLMVERTEQFVDAFWACLYGGLVPVPLTAGASDEHRLKLFKVLQRLSRPALYCGERTFSKLASFAQSEGLQAQLAPLDGRVLRVESIDALKEEGRIQKIAPDSLAFVQFSSGSTQDPKGVMLTHENVLANIDAILTASRATDEDVGLSWMPLTHDMGLVGFHLTPVAGNIAHVLIPTELFVRRPMIWLQRIHEDGATITGAPNFGYQHLLRAFKPDNAPGLSLRKLRLIFNGAEPISVPLVRTFMETLAPLGLPASAMFPVYGLAEGTVAVTAPEAGAGLRALHVDRGSLEVSKKVRLVEQGDPSGLSMVEHGGAVKHCALRIVDDEGGALSEGALGHIQIRGANVTRGFYGAQRMYEDAKVQAESGEVWLRTGDLGFMHEGALVVAGRAKDVIFVNGQNVHPQDLEWAVSKIEGAEVGRVVATSAPSEAGDQVLIFVLHKGDAERFAPMAQTVRGILSERMGIEVHAVVPIKRFPKTTSGKVQRFKILQRYQSGEFDGVLASLAGGASKTGAVDSEDELVRRLKMMVDEVTPQSNIGVDDNVFEIGTSSLTLAQIFERIDRVWPGMIETTDFFDYPTIREVAKYLKERLESGDPQS